MQTMCIIIPPTSAANKSAEQHEEPSEQDSFNHLLYKVLRLTSEQVQDFNDWMEHLGIPNVHELIAQSYRMPHAYMNNLEFIKQGKTCYIQSNVMFFPRRDSNFGEWTRSRGTTLGEQNFPTSPQNKITKLTHCSIYVPMRTISTPQTK